MYLLTFVDKMVPQSCPRCILLPLLLLLSISLACFTSGFFLMRVELPFKSQTLADQCDADGSNSCFMQPRFSKLVFLVIDALRYDFIAPMAGSSCRPGSSEAECQYSNQVRAENDQAEARIHSQWAACRCQKWPKS